MASVTNSAKMFSAIKEENRISSTEARSQEGTSEAKGTSLKQEIADSQNQTKATKDFATTKKFDGQLQASLLKDTLIKKNGLPNAASRLDVLRDGNLSGLAKEAAKLGGDVGAIKDNLGKDIARHDGPGVSDMFKMGRKQGFDTGDPLAGIPQKPSEKQAPDMPYRKNDPSLVSDGCGYEGFTGVKNANCNDGKKEMSAGEKMIEVQKVLKEAGVDKAGADAVKKAKGDGGTQHVDSDPTGYGNQSVEPPAEPPLGAHDKLGHRVDGGNTLVPEYDSKTVGEVVQSHKGIDPALVNIDPEQSIEMTFDPANPPRLRGEELKNTGNPLDNSAPRPAPTGGTGVNPNTDGEGGGKTTSGGPSTTDGIKPRL